MCWAHFVRAAGLGLEPRYTPPEGVVLPLDDPAIISSLTGLSFQYLSAYT